MPAYTISHSAVGCFASRGRSVVRIYLLCKCALGTKGPCTGSGSTYVYGYCDATYQEGWGRDETVNFVKNSTCSFHLSSTRHSQLTNVFHT